MTKPQKIEGGEEEQMRILSKCSPGLLLIVGKHSTLWNYSKLETVERIADLLASERQRCVEEREKIFAYLVKYDFKGKYPNLNNETDSSRDFFNGVNATLTAFQEYIDQAKHNLEQLK